MLRSVNKLRIQLWTQRSVVNLRWYSDDENPDHISKKEKAKTEVHNEHRRKTLKSKAAADRLNMLLNSMSTKSAEPVRIPSPPKKEPRKVEPTEEEKIRAITSTIAKKIGGNVEETESELLKNLLGLKDLKSSGSLSELVSGLKIDDEKDKKPKKKAKDENWKNEKEFSSRAENVRRSMGPQSKDKFFHKRPQRTDAAPPSGVVNLFGKDPLGIFEKASTAKDPLETWNRLQQRELKLAITHPPSNYFEKMILWTEQGKIWQFPIDNEQGMEEEKSADFSEHVLLEMYIEDWCPSSGPVRHFMELICVGLSKNPYLTAKEKKDHVMWYRDYFSEKKDLLGDLMTLGRQNVQEQPKLE